VKEKLQVDGNQELKWIQNPTASVQSKAPNQPKELIKKTSRIVMSFVRGLGGAPAEIEIGAI